MNPEAASNAFLVRIVPPVAAVMLIVAFVSLGLWQLDRAAEKEALGEMFADDAPYRDIDDRFEPTPFEKIETRGKFLDERQVLIDNIVRNGRIGYFVITPLEYAAGEPLLLINRGWIEKQDAAAKPDDLSIVDDWRPVRGRAGSLPRVGIRSGNAFAGNGEWPRIAVYPNVEEVAGQLGQAVLPYVLLLDPGEPGGFMRNWAPAQSGPMTHYGYAFQWFAMALAVVAIGGWQLKKRMSPR